MRKRSATAIVENNTAGVREAKTRIALGKPGTETKSRVSWQTLWTYFQMAPLASSIG